MALRRTVWTSFVILGLGCGGGGDWVDAPQACMGVSALISMEAMKAQMEGKPVEPVSSDLKEVIEQMVADQKKKGASEEDLQKGREGFETLIAQGARTVCGNVGKSYTGTWECNAQAQRVKCQ